MATDEYITLQEAASLLNVTTATLRNWDKSGRLTAVRHPINKYRRFRLADIAALQRETELFATDVTTLQGEIESRGHGPRRATTADLRRLVKSLHRILRDFDGNSSLVERFDELTKLLYCKVYDERHSNDVKYERLFGVTENGNGVAKRARRFFAELVARSPDLFPPRFRELQLQDDAIQRMVEALGTISLKETSDDFKGLAYEEVIKNTFDKGDNQQFFTPPPIVDFMVNMIQPELRGKVCDPACGTGGFLLSVARHAAAKDFELFGFEVDERLAWSTRMNLDMHGFQNFQVKHLDSSGTLGKEALEHLDAFDIIITNPPFGSDLSGDALLDFRLGQNRQSRRRGVLFIERCLALLKPRGTLAIVIDDGVLNGPSNHDVRELILEKSDPAAIISLPETAFMPYASVKASVLFLKKKKNAKGSKANVFFAEAEVVGRKPNGDPLIRYDKSGSGQLDSDLPHILELWHAWSKERREPDWADGVSFSTTLPLLHDKTYSSGGYRLDLAYHHPARHAAAESLRQAPYPVRTLVEICDVRNEAVIPSKSLADEEITYIGLANIEAHTGVCTPTTVSGSALKSAVKRFVGGDIIFAKMRPELRKVCLIPEQIEEGFVSSECLVLTPKRSDDGSPFVLPELLSLFLRTDLLYGQLVHMITGIGRPRLNKAAVLNARLPVPPTEVQERLLKLYGRSEENAQSLMAESEKAIARAKQILADARKRLVTDVLTNA